jgi:hypothetical protein
MVWCAISESPGFDSFARMLERNISSAAATMMRAPFGLADADELSQLVAEAGFREIKVQPRIGTVHFSSVEHFVSSYVGGSPLAAHVAQASDAGRERLISDTKAALEPYVDRRGLSFPIAAHLLTATV